MWRGRNQDRDEQERPRFRCPSDAQPGRCPRCGAALDLRADDVFDLGTWSGRDPSTGTPVGGRIYGANCPSCGVVLSTHGSGGWNAADPSRAVWQTRGGRTLMGGDWRRGRPGAWGPETAARCEARLREAAARGEPLESVLLHLHLTAGAGGVHLAPLVERVAGMPPPDARRLVFHALVTAAHTHPGDA